jgi:hypothetical protein
MATEFNMSHEDVIRLIRNGLLTDSDWTQISDAPLTIEKREEWKQWRQYLRDLPTEFIGLEHYPDILIVTNFPE